MDTMTKSRLFRLWLVLGSAFMVLLIIVYWDNMGPAHFNLHTALSRPHALKPFPSPNSAPGDVFTSSLEIWESFVREKQGPLLSKRVEQPSLKNTQLWVLRRENPS